MKLVLLLLRLAQPARTNESFVSNFGRSLDSRPRDPRRLPEECLRRWPVVLVDIFGVEAFFYVVIAFQSKNKD